MKSKLFVRIAAAALAAVLCLSMTACGSSEESGDTAAQEQTTEITAELMITLLKVLHTRMDVRAGNMIRLEMRSAPIIRMPSTIVTAVSIAIRVLYRSAFTPVACANVSSNVMAKIL